MSKDRKITGSTAGDDVFVFGEDLPSRRPRRTPAGSAVGKKPRPGTPTRAGGKSTGKAKAGTRRKVVVKKQSNGCGAFAMLSLALFVGASGFGIGTLAQAATEMTSRKVAVLAPSAPVSRDFSF
jgi:hypothetical protein